jgi:hypothetical protein
LINIYVGFDEREEAGTHAFVSSVLQHATSPVSFTPLHLKQFRSFYSPGHRDGTNAFIYTRFLIPFLQDFRGWAMFADGADMLCKADISELWALRDHYKAVQVVQHDYKTRHPRKYIGTKMESANEDYPRKNWSSLMLINCQHFDWREMKPETVERMSGRDLHTFSFIRPDCLGYLPGEWNWLADEYGENPEAKLLHWTAGTPAFPHYKDTPHAEDFRAQVRRMNHVTD